ncbi:MAG: sigma-70 family RNA polymerase sigma factor [Dehalococcoidia bacterium]|nr:sigma-70 family RNA polymerase sigma factor [Dehalococcoidia bacterium]MCB9491296.1 sigma-70 family RNA polymerase sigma factor [Dehalococcoidia bacterium]
MDHSESSVSAATSALSGAGIGDPSPPAGRVTGEGEAASPAIDDRELARRLQQRDASALASLYRAYRRRAFGLAYRVLGDAPAAEDAVHAAFLALWERADRIDPDGGKLGALVLTVVHRRAVDLARSRARSQQREAPRSADGDDLDVDPSTGIPDERAQQAFARVLDDEEATRRRLSAALARLPEAQRAVVELAYFEGLTHRAIAERLGLPDGTVKSRLRLGLGHLRDALKTREEGA